MKEKGPRLNVVTDATRNGNGKRLSDFIRENMQLIIAEWEGFSVGIFGILMRKYIIFYSASGKFYSYGGCA